jgi:hypothetical protein
VRPFVVVCALWASGCCLASAAGEPSAPIPAPTTTIDPGCRDLCERIAECDTAEGRTPVAPDCAMECTTGVYASLGATELHCALEPSCAALRQCAGPALALTLLGSIATGAPTTAPPEWPTDLPTVPGGVPRAAPAMGPVRVALLAYPRRDVATIERSYRDALAEAGWSVEDAAAGGGEAHRFVAGHDGESVSMSIYRDGADTIVQTMQLGGAETER